MRYEVTIQLVSATSTLRSRATCGRATTIIVEFNGTSRLPSATEIASHRAFRSISRLGRGEALKAGGFARREQGQGPLGAKRRAPRSSSLPTRMLGREQIAQSLGGKRVRAGVVMSEVRVHVLPRLEHWTKARGPSVDIVPGVALPLAEARVREGRRRSERRDGRGRFLAFGMHERDARGAQKLVDLVDVPRRVPHFQRTTQVARQRREESREPVVVAPEPGWRLEQDRAEPIAERPCSLEEQRQRFRRIAELPVVRDLPRRLQREEELGWGGLTPVGDVLLGRQVVERVIDLKGRKARPVVAKEVLGLHLRRIEDRLPCLVRPARRPDEGTTAIQSVKETRLCRAD